MSCSMNSEQIFQNKLKDKFPKQTVPFLKLTTVSGVVTFSCRNDAGKEFVPEVVS